MWLLACAPDDSAKDSAPGTGPDSDPEPAPQAAVASAPTVFLGAANDGAGGALALDEGRLLVGAQLGNRACAWPLPVAAGALTLDEAPWCWSGGSAADYAGSAVDLAGEAVVVGAVGHSGAAAGAGAALWVRELAEPELEAGWVFTGEAAGDYAGVRVRLRDLDQDGALDLLVGASANDRGGAGAGAVYLLLAPDGGGGLGDADSIFCGTGAEVAGPPAPPHGAPAEGDGVGAVFALGDLDGDGLEDLVLGANGSDAAGADSGAVGVVFAPLPAGEIPWSELDQRWAGPMPSAFAGDEVLAGADLDGDGRGDFVAVEQDGGPGRLRLVPGSDASGELSLLDAPTSLEGSTSADQAGASASLAGDLDGDGAVDLVVGAYGADPGLSDAGVAWVLPGPFAPGNFALADGLTLFGAEEGAWVGRAVAGGADADGDGVPDLLVGAPYSDQGGLFAGAAWWWPGSAVLDAGFP